MIAPGRARRPGAARGRIEPPTPEELETCPFCEGREGRTPPETLALPARERADSPGWRVRVVPNLYPAFEHQEVVVHTPRHARSFAELTDGEVELVAEAWRSRVGTARAARFPYVHALINEGRAAGASVAHSHSQLVWMRKAPPAVANERRALRELLERDELVVVAQDGLAAVVHSAGRAPYELVVAADGGHPDALSRGSLAPALRLLREVVARLRTVEGPVAWNAWLHAGAEWHIELVPRLTVFAGIELGAGIYVNTLAPEEAAVRLREAAV